MPTPPPPHERGSTSAGLPPRPRWPEMTLPLGRVAALNLDLAELRDELNPAGWGVLYDLWSHHWYAVDATRTLRAASAEELRGHVAGLRDVAA